VTEVTVVYHHEQGDWWAGSEDLPGFSAAGSTFAEVAELVREAVRDLSPRGRPPKVDSCRGRTVCAANGSCEHHHRRLRLGRTFLLGC
jgi:hypothetical protein